MYYSKKIKLFEELNLTRKYLTPCLKLFNDDLLTNLHHLNIKAVCINDKYYNKEEDVFKLPPYLFIVIDSNGKQKSGHYIDINKSKLDLINALTYIQNKNYYVDDYVLKDNYHVLIIKIDNVKFNNFINSNYNLIYTNEELALIFNDRNNIIYQVLAGTEYAKNVFIKNLQQEFKGLTSETINKLKKEKQYDFKIFYDKECIR